MAHMESLWPRLADLPLVVESCEYDGLHAVLAHEFNRVTTHVRLIGAGAEGLGEDISLMEEDGTSLHEARPALGLEGEWTLASFSDHLATLDLFVKPPEWEGTPRFRRWAFESAALDLALRQASRALHEVLELEPQPLRFVTTRSASASSRRSTTTLVVRRAGRFSCETVLRRAFCRPCRPSRARGTPSFAAHSDLLVLSPGLTYLLVGQKPNDLSQAAVLESTARNLAFELGQRPVAVTNDKRLGNREVDHHIVEAQQPRVDARRMLDLEEAHRVPRTLTEPDDIDVPHHAPGLLRRDDRQIPQAPVSKKPVIPDGTPVGDPYVVALKQASVAQLRLDLSVGARLRGRFLRLDVVAGEF